MVRRLSGYGPRAGRSTHDCPSPAKADSAAQANRIRELKIFDDEIFFKEVYEPYMAALGLTRQDLRQPRRKTAPVA